MKFFACLLLIALSLSGELFSSEEMREISMFQSDEKASLGMTLSTSTRLRKAEDAIQELKKSRGTRNSHCGYLNVDFLCWRGQGSDWGFAGVDDIMSNPRNVGIKGVRGEPKWKPGIRMEVGFSTPLDWNISFLWTYYHNRSTSAIAKQAGIEDPFFDLFGTTYSSASHINYNTLDLELSTNLSLLNYFTYKPFIAARCLLLRNGYRNHLDGGLPVGMSGISPDATNVIHHHFWGLGPLVGSTAYFRLGKSGLDLFGTLAASLLCGRVSLKQDVGQNVTFSTTQTGPAFNFEFRDAFYDLKTSLQLLLGLQWKKWFDHDKRAVSLDVSWEANYWWDQTDDGLAGAFGAGSIFSEAWILYGANFGLGFDF